MKVEEVNVRRLLKKMVWKMVWKMVLGTLVLDRSVKVEEVNVNRFMKTTVTRRRHLELVVHLIGRWSTTTST